MQTERAQRQSLIDERLREKDEREAEVMADFTNEELQHELFALIQRIGTQKVRVKQLSSEQTVDNAGFIRAAARGACRHIRRSERGSARACHGRGA